MTATTVDGRRRSCVAAANRLPRLPVIAGDFNDLPDGPGPADLEAAGGSTRGSSSASEASTDRRTGQRRPSGRPPTQRLDYVFVPAGWTVVDAAVLASAERFDWFAERSDHLPMSAVIEPPPAR